MLSTLFVTQKVRLKKDYTRDLKKRITPRILKKDYTQDFLLSFRLLNIRQLRVTFSHSILRSYHQSTDLLYKLIDWFLYDGHIEC